MQFFWGKHLDCDVARGPFKRSRGWLAAELQLQIIDLDEEDSDEDSDADSDDSDYEDPEVIKQRAHQRAQGLLDLLPKVFPNDEVETYVVHHDDRNTNNILVDRDGKLTGIID
jgi:aminoglycoside phosphotransferase